MQVEKPTIVFTTFWDADAILKNGGLICLEDGQAFQVEANPDKTTVSSIALGNPDISKMSYESKMERLGFYAPPWHLLKEYKNSKDWDAYTYGYNRQLATNKADVLQHIDSLDPDHLYILCCWENTCKGAHCHRQLLYNALRQSNKTKDKANYIYRDGDAKFAKNEAKLLANLVAAPADTTKSFSDDASFVLVCDSKSWFYLDGLLVESSLTRQTINFSIKCDVGLMNDLPKMGDKFLLRDVEGCSSTLFNGSIEGQVVGVYQTTSSSCFSSSETFFEANIIEGKLGL